MTMQKGCSLAGAGLLVLGAACASSQGAGQNPTAQQAQLNQQQSQQALDRAHEAQRKATEQEQRAAQAQSDVQKLQRQLTDAQRREQQEAAKAQQLQREAAIATQQASQQASQSQQQAIQALGEQQQQAARGEHVASGLVTNLSSDQVVVTPQGGGEAMAFQVTGRTRVEINGQQASLQDIKHGQDARVAYQFSGTIPTATVIQVVTAPGAGPGQGATPQGGSSSQGSTP
jgi:hypothetical protein